MCNVEYRLFCDGWLGYIQMPLQPRIGEQITYGFKDYIIKSIRYSFDFNDLKLVIVGLEEKE